MQSVYFFFSIFCGLRSFYHFRIVVLSFRCGRRAESLGGGSSGWPTGGWARPQPADKQRRRGPTLHTHQHGQVAADGGHLPGQHCRAGHALKGKHQTDGIKQTQTWLSVLFRASLRRGPFPFEVPRDRIHYCLHPPPSVGILLASI